MNDWPYTDIVKDHFMNPRNFLTGDTPDFEADGIGETGSPACGDVMKLWIKVDPKQDKITNLRWKTFGCASAIGSTSMLSEIVLEKGGMSIDAALKITPDDISKRLGGLPTHKVHCSVLGDKALREAIFDYFGKTGQAERLDKAKPKPKILCKCLGVSERELELAIAAGDRTFEDFQRRTKAGTGCGGCVERIKKLIKKKLEQ